MQKSSVSNNLVKSLCRASGRRQGVDKRLLRTEKRRVPSSAYVCERRGEGEVRWEVRFAVVDGRAAAPAGRMSFQAAVGPVARLVPTFTGSRGRAQRVICFSSPEDGSPLRLQASRRLACLDSRTDHELHYVAGRATAIREQHGACQASKLRGVTDEQMEGRPLLGAG